MGPMFLRELTEELKRRKAAAQGMGGPAAVQRQHDEGKLTARERIGLLFDAGTFVELGALADHEPRNAQMAGKHTPADGVITGYGQVDGKTVCCAAYDFTVMAGSMGEVGERKVARMRELALRLRVPIVWLLDSSGARIQETAGSQFAGSGDLFFEQVIMSGVVPQVAAVMGPCAAGTAYIPALADVAFMVKGTGSMALGGPHLVKAAVGEEISAEDLGGSRVHCTISGCADLEAEHDEACLRAVREYLGYLMEPYRPTGDGKERAEELYDIVPAEPNKVYDMRKVVAAIADDGRFFELKAGWAKSIITGLTRMGGRTLGVVASQPSHRGGVLDVDSADKAARFVTLCDAYEIPLLFLVDVPGFLIGSKVEQQGIIRHGAKMLYAVSEATVPKVTVVLRKAYGAGYFVMCGRAYQADQILAWPTAEISVMGPEGAAAIIFRKEIESAENPAAVKAERVGMIRDLISPYVAAAGAYVDDVIDPADTRRLVINAFKAAAGKRVERPARKHGIWPV
ncbi:MAG TPA: acyl-CoA carboxylase subunit beta [Symbiobacteriaceae bacterium]|nr:acyl-CoA carboxylase subunit beta [Symbiobacteriaceae bacterium]